VRDIGDEFPAHHLGPAELGHILQDQQHPCVTILPIGKARGHRLDGSELAYRSERNQLGLFGADVARQHSPDHGCQLMILHGCDQRSSLRH
jgi:hypothetical protein